MYWFEPIVKLMLYNLYLNHKYLLIPGLCTTFFASPVDVVKTRFMNSQPGMYTGALNCAVKMFSQEGMSAFYKG